MTHEHTKGQGQTQRSVGSKSVRVETEGQTDGRRRFALGLHTMLANR